MKTRLEAILEAIICEYVESAEPVGSLTIAEKYDFPFSPATIRGCMAALEDDGYIYQPHTSAGRVPSEKGYRYFVNMVEGEKKLLQEREERLIKRRLQQQNAKIERLADLAALTLAEMTGNVGIVSLSGSIFSHGLPNLFKQPEFFSADRVLGAVDMFDRIHELIRELPINTVTTVYIGSEAPIGKSAGCSLVVSGFNRANEISGSLVVLGPTRMFYPRTIAVIDEVKSFLETV